MPEEEKKEEKQEEKQEEEKVEKQEWDKEKQRADQAEANYDKLAAAKEAMDEELAEQNTKIAEFEEKLAGAAEQKEAELAKMDADLVDKNVIANFEKTSVDLKEAKKRLTAMEKQIKTYKEVEEAKQAKVEEAQRREKILKAADSEFGAKYRNDAIKMANDLIQKGTEDEPADSFEAYVLIAKCYKKLAETDTKKDTKDKKVPVDTGAGGFIFGQEGLKEGSLDEVTTQMKKEGKFKGITFPVP